MRGYKATGEYAHYGEVYLINGKGYALRKEINNSAPHGHCPFFRVMAKSPKKSCVHPNKERRLCKHELGTTNGWNTLEYVSIPDENIQPI